MVSFVSYHLFEIFSETIGDIPAKGILWAIEMERWMIQDDLVNKRTLSILDTISILRFCNFLKAAKHGAGFFSQRAAEGACAILPGNRGTLDRSRRIAFQC